MSKLDHCHCGNCFRQIRFTNQEELVIMTFGTFRPGPGGMPVPAQEKMPICPGCLKEFNEAREAAAKEMAEQAKSAVATGKLQLVDANGRPK